MSQKKVDKYKQEKAIRKDLIKKEKRNRMLIRFCSSVVGIALVGWFGWSVYSTANKNAAEKQTEVNLESVQNYLTDLNADDTEEDVAD